MCCAQIGGTLPAAFGKPGALPHLQLLNVWGNQLSGTLPAEWWLPRLSHAAPRACHILHNLPGGMTLLPARLQTCACSEASMLHTVCNARHAAVAFNHDAHSLSLDKQAHAHAWHLDKDTPRGERKATPVRWVRQGRRREPVRSEQPTRVAKSSPRTGAARVGPAGPLRTAGGAAADVQRRRCVQCPLRLYL